MLNIYLVKLGSLIKEKKLKEKKYHYPQLKEFMIRYL